MTNTKQSAARSAPAETEDVSVDATALELLARAESTVDAARLALLELLELGRVAAKIRSRVTDELGELQVRKLALRSIRKAIDPAVLV